MNDETQVALLFSVEVISNYNLKILAPQGVVLGKASEDTTKFYSSTNNTTYENADEAVRKNSRFCFYYVKTVGELKREYNTDDINEIVKNYLNDSYDRVYYYDNINSDNFNDYFLKNCSIDEFNKKFKFKFEYSTKSTIEQQVDYYGGFFGSIRDYLETSLLFQDRAKKQVISTLYNNFLYNNANSHIILSGPSGVGKTRFLKILSSSNVYPSLYVDFAPDADDTPREYLNSLLINYYYVQLGMNKIGMPGIIMIDNIDADNYNFDLLEFSDELTRLLTTNKRIVPYSKNAKTGVIIDPSKITFIICGQFSRAKKCKEVPIDIFKSKKIKTSRMPVTLDKYDLIKNYNLTDKFLELFNTRVNMNNLSFNKAKQIILNSSTSPLRLYCEDLAKQGIEVSLTESTIDKICKLSYSHAGNLNKLDYTIKSVFDDIILDSQIYSGSKFNLDIGGNQYKKGSKK